MVLSRSSLISVRSWSSVLGTLSRSHRGCRGQDSKLFSWILTSLLSKLLMSGRKRVGSAAHRHVPRVTDNSNLKQWKSLGSLLLLVLAFVFWCHRWCIDAKLGLPRLLLYELMQMDLVPSWLWHRPRTHFEVENGLAWTRRTTMCCRSDPFNAHSFCCSYWNQHNPPKSLKTLFVVRISLRGFFSL